MARKFFFYSAIGACCLLFSAHSTAAADTQTGIQLYQAGKYKEAAAELGQVVKENPDDRRARYYLGLSLLHQEQYSEAESQFLAAEKETAAGSDPALDQIKVGLARAQMDQKDYDQASASLEAARGVNPNNPDIYVYRGKLELLRESYDAAIEQLQKAIEMDPKSAYAHYYAGMAYSKTRRPDKMVAEFQMFLKLAPNAPEAAKVRSLLKGIR